MIMVCICMQLHSSSFLLSRDSCFLNLLTLFFGTSVTVGFMDNRPCGFTQKEVASLWEDINGFSAKGFVNLISIETP
ncbi:hypothetical protein Ahy_B04g069681 isoform B [Arachis hypogaea]|uniref:Uncharacterized protein n=1 Tax=Arachis hypogaea TaxID=3818 RepID=A0A444ZD79_ARAHY|nr:hypothetical protein Ahy_B04g069681 isoform B [Arachis hypogaea]